MPPYLRKVTYAYLERKESALQLLEQNLLHVSQMMTALLCCMRNNRRIIVLAGHKWMKMLCAFSLALVNKNVALSDVNFGFQIHHIIVA
ncbi:hypothetical protein JHK82_030808 [Glycine max]|nr:hypothetical protein JHK85_031451 [Glycine max]KAG5124071.1 hypothetical protein JHK82_030808 [Glycine max]KAG5145487.1 hypothetical protein JHK84_031030 [Glycine max]